MQTGLGSGDLRSALIQKMTQAQSGPIQRIGNRLGNGVGQQARLQALVARLGNQGGRGPNLGFGHNPQAGHGNEQDPMTRALGGAQRGNLGAQGGQHGPGNELDPSAVGQGGAQRGHEQMPPEIQHLMDLFSHIGPEHYPAILQHISGLIQQQPQAGAPGPAAGGPIGPISRGGPVQY